MYQVVDLLHLSENNNDNNKTNSKPFFGRSLAIFSFFFTDLA